MSGGKCSLNLLLWRMFFFAAIIGISVLALSPPASNAASLTLGWDKANHLFAFFAVTWSGLFAYPNKKSLIFIGLLLFGVFIECLQAMFNIGRVFEMSDIVADAAGCALACLMCKFKNNILSRL